MSPCWPRSAPSSSPASPPVPHQETLELFAFMEAADESKRLGGMPVSIKDVLDRVRAEASLGN